ncbi:MAG: hypothetical protein KAJ91_03180 [Candidatus Aenigmarchaeota archaeon]|nr:hypothetical protein [Candidatus Aenigmarchaeota archaeon]
MTTKKTTAKKKVKKPAAKAVKKKAVKPKAKKAAGKVKQSKADKTANITINNTASAVAKSESSQQTEENGKLPIILILLLAFLVLAVIFIAYQFNETVETQTLEQKCIDIQNDPMLRYPCVCKPTTIPDDDEIVYSKTNSLCTCECYIEGVGTQIFEIRAAK